MKIVVCVKQVPANSEISVDPIHGRPNWDSVEIAMNPFDTYALEQGILLKEQHGGEVIALSAGPQRAEEVLREAISCGADSAILLHDEAFAESDSWATSYILAKAIEKLGDVNLIICGKQAVDGDTAQVGPGIAAHLGIAQAAYVSAMGDSGENKVTVTRMNEEGSDICELDLPAVLSVVKDINSPRIPSLRSKMAAKKAEIPVWSAADIGVEPEKVGREGSPTKVIETKKADVKARNTITLDGEPGEIAKQLAEELSSIVNR